MDRYEGESIAKLRKNMTETPTSLKELRTEIDRLDGAIHDLLRERAALVGGLVTAKGEAPSLRPAREMEILRGLAANHDGAIPFPVILHIWREIMAASLSLQMPFSVVLPSGDDGTAYWDMARFHFGSTTIFNTAISVGQIVQDVAETAGAVGVVPDILFEDDTPWWPYLIGAGTRGPRIAARLPLIADQGSLKAYMIACVAQRPTGDDVSLIAAVVGADMGRTKLASLIKGAGFKAELISVADESGGGDRRGYLFEVHNFVAEDDARLAVVAKAEGVFQLKVIGGYAAPISLSSSTS